MLTRVLTGFSALAVEHPTAEGRLLLHNAGCIMMETVWGSAMSVMKLAACCTCLPHGHRPQEGRKIVRSRKQQAYVHLPAAQQWFTSSAAQRRSSMLYWLVCT